MTGAAGLLRHYCGDDRRMSIAGSDKHRVLRWLRLWTPPVLRQARQPLSPLRINLCCGPVKLSGYINIDIDPSADLVVDLEEHLLPFPDASVEVVVCMSAINYFSRERALEIIRDVHRVLRPGGVARFGVQDLSVLAAKYLQRDEAFFFQRLPSGRARFPGETFADKLNHWFYGFDNGFGNCGKYVYDFESLKLLFDRAGFIEVEQKDYQASAIPSIEQIDNRPEQMFFLEARRGSALFYRQKGIELFENKQQERGWQFILHALAIDVGDKPTVRFAVETICRGRRPQDALKLLDRCRQRVQGDPEIDGMSAGVAAQINGESLGSEETAARRKELDAYNGRRNSILSDAEHLHECMQWLSHAQAVSADRGVPTLYDMVQRQWDISYPETTGYIIPTFLAYARWSGKAEYRQTALEMGDWEIDIQALEGGAGEPVGGYNLPRVFNTGQVLFGWLALFRETGDQRYLHAAETAAQFIVHHLDADGRWVSRTFLNAPRSYKIRVAWALLELFEVTRHKPYRMAAQRAVGWVLTRAHDNGWFDSNSISSDNRAPITHSIGYTLVGLLEIYRLHNVSCDYRRVLAVLKAAADNVVAIYRRQCESKAERLYRGLPARLDARWRSSNQWSCVTGNTQIEFFLRRLLRHAENPDYLIVSNALLDEMKTIHLVDGIDDESVRGGLYGSDPIGGGYCPYAMPNWGVKFFADSLLQRVLPPNEPSYLG